MKKLITLTAVCLSMILVGSAVALAEDDYATTEYSFWLGGHYTDFEDYSKKVGEYMINEDQAYPEWRLDLLSTSAGKLMSLKAHYFDDQNINANLKLIVGDRMSLRSQYRSLTHQTGQDLLTNLAAKEATGGKFLTNQLKDPNANYYSNRHEILNEFNVQLSKKNNVRFLVAHRSIIEKGHEQQTSTNHCWGCHVVGQTAEVDDRTHQVTAGIQGDVAEDFLAGYEFGYRRFESRGDPTYRYYDTASHPVFVDSVPLQDEFGSRLIYDDTTARVGYLPETEKMSHKVRFKGNVGKGRLASSFGFARTENKTTEWKTDAFSGAINYATLLGPKTRLLAKASGVRMTSDEELLDLPLFRAGRPGPDGTGANVDFDTTLYSSIDRLDARISAEVIHRLTNQWTIAALGGFERIDRDDYPVVGDGLATSRFIGQVKARYRKGLTYSSRVKFRYEKTTDPFVSSKGLFEYDGSDSLAPVAPGFSFILYHQREDLRYQTITTEPTDRMEFEWNSNWRPDSKLGLNVGVRGSYDKNNDLDSLDVEHFTLVPNLNVNLMPTPQFVVTAGYTFNHHKSRGPVAVALFDG